MSGSARPDKTRRRCGVNFNFLDEPERALVLFRLRIFKIKRARRDRFVLTFCFFLVKQKEIEEMKKDD